jgi:hypothetical protein
MKDLPFNDQFVSYYSGPFFVTMQWRKLLSEAAARIVTQAYNLCQKLWDSIFICLSPQFDML